jgi:Putative stress-induced transcription regulator
MKVYSQVIVETHRFSTGEIIGGDAALDFINTVTGRDQSPRDWLESYARLLEWAELVRLLPKEVLRALARKARREPAGAATALARAKELRETLFALVTGIISGSAPSKAALALLREHWIAGINAHELCFHDGHVVAELCNDAADFDLIASWRLENREPPGELLVPIKPILQNRSGIQHQEGNRVFFPLRRCLGHDSY